jgi:hypothetical protein
MLRLQRRLGGRKRTLMELRQLRAFLERSSEPPATGGFGDGYAKKMSSALAAIIDLIAIRAGGRDQPPVGPKSLGPTARFISDHGPCPVLLLREGR